MKPFVTLGDLVADFYVGIERLPVQAGRHQDVSDLALGPGGAGNALTAAARLGLPCIALGGLGQDWVGQRIFQQLQAEGVNVDHLTWMPNENTAVAVVLRAERGEHVFLGYYGTRGPQTLPAHYLPILQNAGVLMVDGWTFRHDWPAPILAGMEIAYRAGVSTLFDPGPQLAELDVGWLRAMLNATRVLLATQDEARVLQRKLGAVSLNALPQIETAIIKHGAGGCVISTPQRTFECAGFSVEVKDLTAAGDCFAAGVAWGIWRGLPWEMIGVLANAVGAAKVQKIGTALSAPTRAEVAALLHAQRPEVAAQLNL